MLIELDWETPFLCAHGIIDFPANKYIFYRDIKQDIPRSKIVSLIMVQREWLLHMD